jgi:ComF family protein
MVSLRACADLIIETVFPTHCVSCAAWGDWWCPACREAVSLLKKRICPQCASVKTEHVCDGDDSLDALCAAGFYHDPVLRSVIHALKYRGATEAIPSIRRFLHSWRDVMLEPWPWAGESHIAIQPIPSSPARIRARGFDQSASIALIARDALIPWAEPADLLQRSRNGGPQSSLPHGPLREANIHGVFTCQSEAMPRAILLVDDVVTSGASFREAARVLKSAGAQRVYAIALAVGA